MQTLGKVEHFVKATSRTQVIKYSPLSALIPCADRSGGLDVTKILGAGADDPRGEQDPSLKVEQKILREADIEGVKRNSQQKCWDSTRARFPLF